MMINLNLLCCISQASEQKYSVGKARFVSLNDDNFLRMLEQDYGVPRVQ